VLVTKKILKVVLWGLLILLVIFAIGLIRNWDTIQRTMLGGLKVYETEPPAMPAEIRRPAILIFSKTNGFRHEEAIPAANALFAKFAKDNGWGYFQTENGATFSPEVLAQFDAVIFNNVSGDVFTPDQRAALKAYVEKGGGFLGFHGSGGDFSYDWRWYVEDLIGAQFKGHPLNPQFQQAMVHVEDRSHPATAHLAEKWQRTDEWYSFVKPPRKLGYHILATLDEKTYEPGSMFGTEHAMGTDHPIAWWHCVGDGRVLYSALGHQPTAYAEPEYRKMLLGATNWVLRKAGAGCNGSATNKDSAQQGE
jgi:type 1 glutamine amidotransferase